MGVHDTYVKNLLRKFFGNSGANFKIHQSFDIGGFYTIDASTDEIAIEIESHISKQIRGVVLDFLLHHAPKNYLLYCP